MKEARYDVKKEGVSLKGFRTRETGGKILKRVRDGYNMVFKGGRCVC